MKPLKNSGYSILKEREGLHVQNADDGFSVLPAGNFLYN